MKELIEIQKELKAPKNQENKFQHYNYRSCEDILEAVKPLCYKYGCFLVLSDEVVLIGERYYVKSTATLTNKEGQSVSVSAYAREQEKRLNKQGQETMDHSQITGSTSSYARKYNLNGLFCIDDTKDADTMDNSADYRAEDTRASQAGVGGDSVEVFSSALKGINDGEATIHQKAKLKIYVAKLERSFPTKAKGIEGELAGNLSFDRADELIGKAAATLGEKI